MTTEGFDGLGGQAQVPHHRHAGLDDMRHQVELPGFALDLDGVGARLHEFLHRVHGKRRPLAYRKERHVAHHELARRTPAHGAHVQRHHLDRGVHGAVEAMHDHGETVAHEQGVDLGVVEHLRRPAVVTGDHGDGMVCSLALAKVQYVHAFSPCWRRDRNSRRRKQADASGTCPSLDQVLVTIMCLAPLEAPVSVLR